MTNLLATTSRALHCSDADDDLKAPPSTTYYSNAIFIGHQPRKRDEAAGLRAFFVVVAHSDEHIIKHRHLQCNPRAWSKTFQHYVTDVLMDLAVPMESMSSSSATRLISNFRSIIIHKYIFLRFLTWIAKWSAKCRYRIFHK